MENCTTITGLQALDQAYLVRTDSADIQLYFVTDEIIRVRASFDRVFPEASYVLALTAWEDRLDMAVSLAELHITSIPINALMPIKGTGLENQPRLTPEEIMRTIAIFRFINPEANIRLAAGRKLLPENGAAAFTQGASASITGNMLTTSGTTIKEDLAMLESLGLSNA